MTEQLRLDLFADVEVVPTISMLRGTSFVAQCRQCGTLACVPGGLDDTPASRRLGACPSCGSSAGWLRQDLSVGPFRRPGSGTPIPSIVEHIRAVPWSLATLCGSPVGPADAPMYDVARFAGRYGQPCCPACRDLFIAARTAEGWAVCPFCLAECAIPAGGESSLWPGRYDRCYGCQARALGYDRVPDLGFMPSENARFRLEERVPC